MTEPERLVALLESARKQYGAEALRRIESPIRAAAELEPPAPTGDPLRDPEGLFIPGIKSAAWHTRDWMPDVAILEAAAPAMRSELDALLGRPGGFQPFDEGEDYGFTPENIDGQWNVYYVVLGCREVPSAAAACPRTAATLKSLPNLGMAGMFSALTPGTHLWAHCGPTNAVVSLSMGLIAPPGCVIRVGTEERTWREGECLVFDDTYEHEVWHRGDRTRFIMLVDVWHPELTPVERRVLGEALWAPGEVENRLKKGRAKLDGQKWWQPTPADK
jgi:aspartyl/asparaginyl beta-hydroxylase (cupin superfamily)